MYFRLKSAMAAIAAAAALLAPIASQAAIVGFSLTIDDATNSVSSRLAGVSFTTLGVQQWRLDFTGSAVVRANITVATGDLAVWRGRLGCELVAPGEWPDPPARR